MFSKKATKIDKIFTVDLTICRKCQIDGEDFVNFCGLLRKHELYRSKMILNCPNHFGQAKGQLISEYLFEKIVWTKIPTKNLIDSAQQV